MSKQKSLCVVVMYCVKHLYSSCIITVTNAWVICMIKLWLANQRPVNYLVHHIPERKEAQTLQSPSGLNCSWSFYCKDYCCFLQLKIRREKLASQKHMRIQIPRSYEWRRLVESVHIHIWASRAGEGLCLREKPAGTWAGETAFSVKLILLPFFPGSPRSPAGGNPKKFHNKTYKKCLAGIGQVLLYIIPASLHAVTC